MTEALFQKLEEKTLMLLSEVEGLRDENRRLRHENTTLKIEKERFQLERMNHEQKLQELISLFDSVNQIETALANTEEAA